MTLELIFVCPGVHTLGDEPAQSHRPGLSKVTDLDYIQFLIAAQGVYTCTEAARCALNASHDAYTRLLTRLPPDTAALWQEVEPLVALTHGLLVIDDTTLDKPYARKMGLVSRH